MSRYSPTVTPTPRQSWTSMLGDALQTYEQTRDFKKNREQQDTARELGNYQAGLRPGQAPEDHATLTMTPVDPGAFRPPSSDELARQLANGGTPAPETAAPFTPKTPAFQADQAAGDVAQAGQPTGGYQPIGAAAHPGGFDPQTHTFGGTPQRHAAVQSMQPQTVDLGPSGRYVQLNKGHYLDTQETPEARAAAARLQEFELEKRLTAELNQHDPKYQAELLKALSGVNTDAARNDYYRARADATRHPAARQPTPDKPGEAAHRTAETTAANASAAHSSAETTELAERAKQRVADQIIQALAGQNPGRKITAEAASQYLGGLQRNGKAPRNLTTQDVYAALDRYHNPPNRAETPQSIMAKQMSEELTGGKPATPRSGATPAAPNTPTKPSLPPLKRGTAAKDRYAELSKAGLQQSAILAQMQREGFPPPPKR